jgi:hypothetical protein
MSSHESPTLWIVHFRLKKMSFLLRIYWKCTLWSFFEFFSFFQIFLQFFFGHSITLSVMSVSWFVMLQWIWESLAFYSSRARRDAPLTLSELPFSSYLVSLGKSSKPTIHISALVNSDPKKDPRIFSNLSRHVHVVNGNKKNALSPSPNMRVKRHPNAPRNTIRKANKFLKTISGQLHIWFKRVFLVL